jgi:hypothetical protein
MPVKRYNGTAWEVIAGDGAAGAPGTNGASSRFVLTGERNGDPASATYFAFGNGVTTRNDVVFPYSCTLDAISAFAQTAFTGTFTFQVHKNGSSIASLSINSGSTTAYTTGLNVSISPGDTIGLYCLTGAVGGTIVTVNAWFQG